MPGHQRDTHNDDHLHERITNDQSDTGRPTPEQIEACFGCCPDQVEDIKQNYVKFEWVPSGLVSYYGGKRWILYGTNERGVSNYVGRIVRYGNGLFYSDAGGPFPTMKEAAEHLVKWAKTL